MMAINGADPPQYAANSQRSSGTPPGRAARFTGLGLSAVAVLFLAFDASMKLLQLGPAIKGTVELGYPASVVFGLGVLQAVCLLAYLVPQTAVLGCVLWTGYLGGAVATHVRLSQPLFSHELFPLYVAILLWSGLWLRDARVRQLLPLRQPG